MKGSGEAKGKGRGDVPTYASQKNDKAWILAEVVRRPGCATLRYACSELRKDREFALEVVSRDGFALADIDEDLRKDKAIVLAAISQNPYALFAAEVSLRKDSDVLAAAGLGHLLGDFSSQTECLVMSSFDACRWIATGTCANMKLLLPTQTWRSPRQIVDTMLPCCGSLGAANPLKNHVRGMSPVSLVDVDVHLTRPSGEKLDYVVTPNETVADLKARIASDLGSDVQPFKIILLLGFGPSEPLNDLPLSTYCESGCAELTFTLLVSLRDVCMVASQGSRDALSSKAFGVLLREAVPEDDLAIDAALECFRNEDWDSYHLLLSMRLLQRLLPPQQACYFFGACLGAEPISSNINAIALEALLLIWRTKGREFVSESLHVSKVDATVRFLQAVLDGVGPRGIGARNLGEHIPLSLSGELPPKVFATVEDWVLHVRSVCIDGTHPGNGLAQFCITLGYDKSLAEAAFQICQDPSRLEEISERQPSLKEALVEEASLLEVSLDEVLPSLHVTLVDGFGYPPQMHSTSIFIAIRYDCQKNATVRREKSTMEKARNSISSLHDLCGMAMQMLSCTSESARLAIEGLTRLAPPSYKEALKVACYASCHRDASVREEALLLLLQRMQEADMQYVSRLLQTRNDVHSNRILKELLMHFKDSK